MFIEKIHNRRNQKWIDLDKMRSSSLPLVMYGAGINAVLCATFLKQHSIRVDAVCVTERNSTTPGRFFNERPVITLKEAGETFDQFNCLIAFADITTARKNLDQLTGVREVFFIENPGVVDDIDCPYVEANHKAFQDTYDLLADETSRKAFIRFLNIRISGEPIPPSPEIEPQYFCDVLPLGVDETFVDCGAYDGDTIISFVEKTAGHYRRIYALEPDNHNFTKLQQNIAARNIQRVELIKKGAWEKHEVLRFNSPASTASRISRDGACQIEVDSIDNVVGNGPVTLIKMDIEGAELSALKGAQAIIAREKPRLAISVYHKAEDLISIPQHLASHGPESRYYLRNHSCFSLETVLYVIPK